MPVKSQVWSEIPAAAAGAMSVFVTMTWQITFAPRGVTRVASAAVASLLRGWQSTCSLRRSRVTHWIMVGSTCQCCWLEAKEGKAERRIGFMVSSCLWHEARMCSRFEFCTGALGAQIAAEPLDVDTEMRIGTYCSKIRSGNRQHGQSGRCQRTGLRKVPRRNSSDTRRQSPCRTRPH